MDTRYKYPRTPHLKSSPGYTDDDVFSNAKIEGNVVVTEKMDGECTTLYWDGLHARSIDSKSHPSRDWIKQFHATFAHDIPNGMRICGENLYAKHSIRYSNLKSYFIVFSIWIDDTCLSWDQTVLWAEILGLETVPTIYAGKALKEEHYYSLWYTSVMPRESEGFVVRNAEAFSYKDFSSNVAKWVRPSHVQTNQHWMSQPVVPNKLKK